MSEHLVYICSEDIRHGPVKSFLPIISRFEKLPESHERQCLATQTLSIKNPSQLWWLFDSQQKVLDHIFLAFHTDHMSDVYIGKGKLAGRGVYAARDFKQGEIVKFYHLQKLTQSQFDRLPKNEQMFVHSFWGEMYLFPEPSRYTNHSAHPNTYSDLQRMCDIALRPIKKGEMITINATNEVQNELKTFIEVYEKGRAIRHFKWLQGGYRNAVIRYSTRNTEEKTLKLKRVQGNWRVLSVASAS